MALAGTILLHTHKRAGAAYRRALFALERGRCVMCGLDCHTLVKRLQAGTSAFDAGHAEWSTLHSLACCAHAAAVDYIILRPDPQTVERDTPCWQERRRQLIANAAPRFLVCGALCQLTQMICCTSGSARPAPPCQPPSPPPPPHTHTHREKKQKKRSLIRTPLLDSDARLHGTAGGAHQPCCTGQRMARRSYPRRV